MNEKKTPEDIWAGLDEPAWNIWMYEWWTRNTALGLSLMQGMSEAYFQQVQAMLDQFKDHDPK